VEKWEGEGATEENVQGNTSADSGMDIANTSAGSGMDVDEDPADAPQPDTSEDSEDNDDAEDSSDVAMVPMADMLNARYGSENAGTFFTHRYSLAEVAFRQNCFMKKECYGWSRRNQSKLVNKFGIHMATRLTQTFCEDMGMST